MDQDTDSTRATPEPVRVKASPVPAVTFGTQHTQATDTDERLPSVCPECSEVFARDDTYARCPRCHPSRGTRPGHRLFKGTPSSRGYDSRWRRLSERARKAQPWCLDCGSPYDLTADHSPEAWTRHELGLPLRLVDVDVVCRRCNSERGPARGPGTVDRPARAPLPHVDPDEWPDP